jgi:hypothetical protein
VISFWSCRASRLDVMIVQAFVCAALAAAIISGEILFQGVLDQSNGSVSSSTKSQSGQVAGTGQNKPVSFDRAWFLYRTWTGSVGAGVELGFLLPSMSP